ncbi:TonB-dependent siderophore receptor [uncultured Shewanella sp.]|uniref:TonB-dependent receptor n=1 Tax=uncultured Shewanella sp. TaxID=173975 RepID=UPI002628C401|nr:TonB-dependent receptor [uncultured Shewanella sp.]
MLLTPRFKMKALALSMSLVCVTVTPTYATQAQAINVKPASVGSALSHLAKTNNIDIYATKNSLEHTKLPDHFVSNTDSMVKVLTEILANTDLEAHWLNEAQVVIKQKSDMRAADQLVTFDNNLLNYREDLNNIERISVYGRHNRMVLDSSTATKSNMSLMETPAAIVVVDSELLGEQGITTLQESIRNVSGLTQAGNNYGIGDNLVIRGLGANYTLDGMYGGASLGNSYNPTRSLTNIESLEILKGPATGLYGMGAAGGVINMIEKKPQYDPSYQIQTSVGQWGSHSLMFDATAPITEQTAYRLVGSYESSDGYRGLSAERSEVYATLSHQLNDNNKFILSAAYIDDEIQIDSIGHPVRILNYDSIDANPGEISGQDLPNDTNADGDEFYGIQLTPEQQQQLADSLVATDGLEPYDLGEQGLISPLSRPNEGQEMRLKLQHEMDIDTNIFLHQQFAYREYSSDFVRQTGAYNYVYWNRNGEINADPRAPLVIDGVLYPYAARRQEYRRTQADEKTWQYFADLTMTWSLPIIEGEHLFSANYENRDMALKSWSAYDADGASDDANAIPYILDIRNPNWGTGTFEDYDPVLKSNYDKSVSAWGVSFQEVLYFGESLTGRFGVAYSGTKQSYQHKGTDNTPEASVEADTDDAGATYNLGLNYRINEQLATFVNYSKGRMAYSILDSVNGTTDDRPDSESLSFDVGVRFTAFDEDLLGSLVWFKTQRTNLRYSNPEYNDNSEDVEFNISVPQYYYDNNDTTKGVEFDLNLALNDVWSMNLNATYQDAYTIRSEKEPDQIKVNTKGIPKKFASLWSNYQYQFTALPAPITFGLGVTYEDERSINSAAFGLPDAVVDAYVLWDASIAYQIEQWDIQLSLRNLTDTTYYSKALFIGGLPGDGRNAKLTVSYMFD